MCRFKLHILPVMCLSNILSFFFFAYMFTHRLLHTKQLCSGELLCFKLLFLLGWLFLLVAALQATCHACVFAVKLELDFSRKVIWI